MRATCLPATLLWLSAQGLRGADWIRAGVNTNQPMWGLRNGLLWALPPGGFWRGEPRGLTRLGYPVLTHGAHDLVNFIAIEPIVNGRRGFSELEPSAMDHTRGKRLWAVAERHGTHQAGLVSGTLIAPARGVEQLEVTVRVEPFDNGAKVRLTAAQRSDAPDEFRFTLHTDPGSAPMEYCILTATMGNLVRTRRLWFQDAALDSRQLRPRHTNDAFAPHRICWLDRLPRTAEGGVLVARTTDETEPASVFPFPGTRRWHYGGSPVTQYWRKPRGTFREDLHAVVNARNTYWQSRHPIPGGVAFENFELRERFFDGQQFVFGITRRTSAELGTKSRTRQAAQSDLSQPPSARATFSHPFDEMP